MNDNQTVWQAGDNERLDRLVDGELSEAERTALLEQLEREPDGWRRCALAFLEAQSWGQEMRALVREPAATAASVAHSKPRRVPFPSTWLAMAASFLVAFGLGVAMRGMPSTSKNVFLAEQPQAGPASPAPQAEDVALTSPHQQPTLVEPERSQPVEEDRGDDPWAGGLDEALVVATNDEWLEAYGISSPAIPPHVVRAFEQMGHQVRRYRELLPIELEDGRRGLVPTERIELHYVGNQYQ